MRAELMSFRSSRIARCRLHAKAWIVAGVLSLMPRVSSCLADDAMGSESVITLAEAVTWALAHNHGLAASEAAYEGASWAHRQAKTQLLPSISLESSYTRLDDKTVARANAFGREITMFFPDSTGTLQPFTIEIPQTVFRDGYQTSLNARMLLLNPAVINGVALAGAAKDVAAWQREVARRTTVHATVRAYIELLKMQALQTLQREHEAQAARSLAQAERLAALGRYGEADVLRWRVELVQQRSILAETQRGLRLAALNLAHVTGLDPTRVVSVDSVLPPSFTEAVARFRALDSEGWEAFLSRDLMGVIEQNPQVRVLEGTERLSRREHAQSIASFLPSVTITGSYGWQNNDTPDLDGERTWAITAALSMPVFTSLSNYTHYQTTKSKVRQTQETVREARRQLMLGAESTRTALRVGAARLELAETALASARRGFEIQQNRFALGRLSNLEWIDANLALRSAEHAYLTSYYDLLLAIADYYETTGEIAALLKE